MTTSEPCYIFCVRKHTFATHDPDETKNYLYFEDCITNERCIDCVLSCLQYIDLSFEAMEKRKFSIWFMAIHKHRLDIVEKLIEYGCEEYSNYRYGFKNGSYNMLLSSFLYCVGEDTLLEEFLGLFLAAGIPLVDEAFDICDWLILMLYNQRETYFQLVFNVLKDYGFKEEIADDGSIKVIYEPEI